MDPVIAQQWHAHIGKNIKNIRVHIEIYSFDKLEPTISCVKGVGTRRQEEPLVRNLAAACHLDKQKCTNSWQPWGHSRHDYKLSEDFTEP